MNTWRSLAAMAMAGALLAACTPRKESTLPTPTTLPTVFPTSTQSLPAATPTQASTAVPVKGPTKPKGSPCVKGTVRTNLNSAALSRTGRYIAFGTLDWGSNSIENDLLFWLDRSSGCLRKIPKAWGGVSAISANGRLVLFSSSSSTLVKGDTNNSSDLFVWDASTGRTARVAVSSKGTQPNRNTYNGTMTPDGRYVVFSSAASNLVPQDTNGSEDIFLRDLKTKQTTRVSVSSDGAQAAKGAGFSISTSTDARYIAFTSESSDLVPGDTNDVRDAFVHDRVTRTTERVSVSASGEEANGPSSAAGISGDGRFVVFNSRATNLVQNSPQCDGSGPYQSCQAAFLRDRMTGDVRLVSTDERGSAIQGFNHATGISESGGQVLVDGAPEECTWWVCTRAYVWNRSTGTSELLAGDEYGTSAEPSWDGRYALFWEGEGFRAILVDRATDRQIAFNKVPKS